MKQSTTKINIREGWLEEIWGLHNVRFGKIFHESHESTDGRVTGEIISDEGKFVYKIPSPFKTRGGVEKDTQVFDALRERDFLAVPKLRKTKDGNNFQSTDSRFIYLIEFIDGENLKSTPEDYRTLARVIARMHEIGGFPFETDFAPASIIKDLHQEAEQYSFCGDFRKFLSSLPDFTTLPKTVIHTDIHPDHAIRKPDGAVVRIDWDDAGIGPTVLDLGYIMFQFITEDLLLGRENLAAFYETYFSARRIKNEEVKYMFDGGLFFAMMYLKFGDVNKRWKRIRWAVRNRSRIESSVQRIYAGTAQQKTA